MQIANRAAAGCRQELPTRRIAVPTIAFISGQPALTAVLARKLRGYGHDVVTCPTPTSLHSLSIRDDIDLALLDSDAAGGTPVELANELRTSLGMARPVIVMTSADAAFRPLFVAAGFDAVLPKPVTPLQLHVCALAFAPSYWTMETGPSVVRQAMVIDFLAEKQRRQESADQALNSAS